MPNRTVTGGGRSSVEVQEHWAVNTILGNLKTAMTGTMPDREVMWVRRLFERAIGGFYAVTLKPKGWHVQLGVALQWPVDHKTAGIDKILARRRAGASRRVRQQ